VILDLELDLGVALIYGLQHALQMTVQLGLCPVHHELCQRRALQRKREDLLTLLLKGHETMPVTESLFLQSLATWLVQRWQQLWFVPQQASL
jgi:hypothetical protein